MPTTTTNNAWPIPLDADPFKDGALAMRNLGNAIDTSTGNGLKAWVAYSPTISATSGSFTTLVTNASFCQIGKTVHMAVSIGITTAGTASGGINVTLPVTAKTGIIAVGSGRENSATGNQLQAYIAGTTATCQIWQYNNATTIASGRTVLFSLTYEAA
jgi:hypothetical protein